MLPTKNLNSYDPEPAGDLQEAVLAAGSHDAMVPPIVKMAANDKALGPTFDHL